MYLNYKANYYTAKKENRQFESYANQEIYGAELATIINKAVDNNQNNEVAKDDKGKYITAGVVIAKDPETGIYIVPITALKP